MRFRLTAIFALLFPIVATAASAQDIFVTPIAGAPFHAVVEVQRLHVHPDGSIANLRTIREIGRDSLGRIHNEARQMEPASSSEAPEILHIHLYDPQTRISTMLHPRDHTFSTRTMSHPPSTVPPSVRYGSPTVDSLPKSEFAKEEDLGVRDMESLPVHGVRETQTIPAEASGTGKEVVVTDEYWYSDDLRINMMIKHTDPRNGTVTMTVTEVTRTEPDPSFFLIPEGYKPRGAEQPAR
jgi:hypothetical protein